MNVLKTTQHWLNFSKSNEKCILMFGSRHNKWVRECKCARFGASDQLQGSTIQRVKRELRKAYSHAHTKWRAVTFDQISMCQSHFRGRLRGWYTGCSQCRDSADSLCETFRSFRESTHRPLCRAIKFSVCRAHGVRHEYDRERKRVCPVRHVEPRVLLEPKSRAEWPVY